MRSLRAAARRACRWQNADLRSVVSRLRELKVRDFDVSAVLSVDDSPGIPNERLLDLIAPIAQRARTASLPVLRERQAPAFVHTWPGEHYRFLAALVEETRPANVVEIGTCQGFSALAMMPALRPDGTLTTFDLYPWDVFPGTVLRRDDFTDPRLRQVVADFGDVRQAREHADILRRADIIFIDAAKDGQLEQLFLDNFKSIGLRPGTLLVFDDIRLWNMLLIWRGIRSPKLDVTSIGHHTGTGMVFWQP